MKVTILVAIRDYIERECYESLLHQTYPDCSILVHQLHPVAIATEPPKNKTGNVTRNRNMLRKAALATDSTHFMLVDSDTVLPPHCIETLLSRGKDIIAAWCPMVNCEGWICMKWEEGRIVHIKPREGITEVDMAPLGCMLVTRKVLEDIEFNPALEESVLTKDGAMMFMGETAQFGLDAQAKGYTLFMDGSLICKHLPKNQSI